ncbi:uncharacterized protein LOC128245129 isoform X2 [Mya arenaria]|uniref:uncharacterized protein LOC128245129 isoform X2 n=1 Tax=Mya arenaria TaxID=6604 RepID=UPI0022E8D295|nr:uncharacterized protein LOC128245129 isoform X2 [Mya arenaria]
MLELYQLTDFSNFYLTTGTFTVAWSVRNDEYSNSGSYEVIVENEIWDFTAWLDNPIIYLAVGDTHHFEANATQGTDVTLTWSMETGGGGTVSKIYKKQEFTYGDISYTFKNPKHNITVTASNRVSSESVVVVVEVLYYINSIVFETDDTLANTTTAVDFRLLLDAAADLPMHIVNITIDYKHGTNSFEQRSLFEDATVPDVYSYSHLFNMQGDFLVVCSLQNVLGVYNRTILMTVWDSLLDLSLAFVNGSGKYITNTTAEFNFTGLPVFGFKYSINYGDGSMDSYTADDIMYSFYNLSTFTHIYTKAGLYTLTWTAMNGYPPYNRLETISILIQNRVPIDGYTLEPSLKKYPWLNLQSMDISVNITLNASSHLPTDATCVFWPDDGEPSVPGLAYDDYFFQHKHRYLQEGVFNSSFNCSNEVSWFIYQYSIEVEKYNASYVWVDYHPLVPLNVSDSVVVFFHVQTGGFALIPFDVTLTWDYGVPVSARRRRATTTFDQVTYSNTYNERGDCIFSLYVEALTTNTTSYLEYPLRLGIMHFEYPYNISFINYTNLRYTMHGELGSFHTFTIDFDDTTPSDNCNATDINGCFIEHVCPTWGYHLVTATASNGTFIEFDQVNMTCENPIVNLTTDIPITVSIPDGIIDAMLRIPATALYLPVLHCRWNMGDPIDRDNYQFTQSVTYASPYLFANFQYIALGRHTITIHCWNLINETSFEQQIVVTNDNFLFTGVFDRYYSQSEGPMHISSMVDTEIFSRLEIVSASYVKTHFNQWQLNVSVGETNPNRHGLVFSRGVVKEKKYYVVLRVGFVEEPTNAIFEPTYVEFVMPIPHAEIVGGSRRYVPRGIVTLDAYSVSFDPVYPSNNTLTYTWKCKGYNVASFDEAEAETGGQTCSTSGVSPGVLTVDTTAGPNKDFYVVEVTVNNNRGGVASFTQILGIKNTDELSIKCTINCLAKVAVTSKIQLTPVLIDNCPASFTWTLKKHDGSKFITEDLTSISKTGTGNRTLTIESNSLSPGSRYLVSLTMVKNSITYGPAFYEFVTNLPPQGGHCRVIPYDDVYLLPITSQELINTTFDPTAVQFEAGVQKFNLTCIYWEDEGWTDSTFSTEQPLLYYFYVQYSQNDYERQIIYFDPGATSNLVSFQVGDPNNAYAATVVIRISDIFGDYFELKYNVTSKPALTTQNVSALTTTSARLQVVMNFVSQFDDEMIKANRTADYRTLCRRVMDVTSIYNKLELNISSDMVLEPEDLTSLGFQTTENGELLTWSDFWDLIVDVADTTIADYLMEVGDSYAAMINWSIMTWPSTKRMTIVAIETVSRALNATLSEKDFANVTAAVLSAQVANKLAGNLAQLTLDRVFPNTDQLDSAATGVIDLIKNCLDVFQTILTPNLPQDPTVDEMRNYLEYIKVFKSVDGVGAEPLSLQEQTFLAQKQLQKYYVQKHIKSASSREALPDLTVALTQLTEYLTHLTQMGDPENKMENDYVYISSEMLPANEIKAAGDVHRPRVTIELGEITPTNPGPCSASTVILKTIIFKHNPYFWGQFADRITSYVPVFQMAGAVLATERVVYRLENKEEALCRDATPTYDQNDPDKMIYILFDRQHAEDDILIFLRPNASQLVYDLYFNKEEKPDMHENKYFYTTEMKVDKWTPEDGYKLIIKSSEFSATGKIWIGLRPLLENSGDVSLLTKPFCANITSVNCLAWVHHNGEDIWDKNKCEVSASSTRTHTVCDCENTMNTAGAEPMTVGTTFYVPYNKIDFKSEQTTALPIGRGPVIAIAVAVSVMYALLIFWAWREDQKDQYKWSYSLLIDNDIADSSFYIIRVYTGLRSGSGTDSKIGFVLVGESGDTGIRRLDDDTHIGFEQGSVRTFVMSTRRYIGDLLCMRIWHDDTGGNNSSWFLNKIVISDLRSGKRCTFACDQWFDYDTGDTKVDRVLNAQPANQFWSFMEMVSYTIAEHHLWLSVYTRPMKSNFTRVQRLSCLLGLIFLTMIAVTMTLQSPDENIYQIVIGPFRFAFENFLVALVALLISTTVIMIVTFFFKNAESDESARFQSTLLNAYRKANSKIQFDKSVIGRIFVPPAEEALQYNYYFLPHFCVYVGWTILAMAIAVASYFIYSFSDSWELIKSEYWMSTIFVSFFCSIMVTEVIKVIFFALLYLMLCPRAYEAPDPFINKDNLEEITKHNSATLTIGPQFQSVLPIPENPDDDALFENKINRIRNHQLLKIFTQLSLYSALLYMVYTISYESRDPRSFIMKDHLVTTFKYADSVKDLKTYTKWLNETFVDNYFSKSYYGAAPDGQTIAKVKPYMEDLTNLRVGPARLRQVRIQSESCIGPLRGTKPCHGIYNEKEKETTNYCLKWKSLPCPVAEKSEYFTSPAWLFNSSDEVWGFSTIAKYNTYGGGGYFMKLDVNSDVSVKIFTELIDNNWFDDKTRAVILEFSVYNANSNLFAYSKYVAEFPEVGGFIPFVEVYVFRLYLNTGPDGDFVLFLQFIFVLLVVFATLNMLYDVSTDTRAFLRSVWNYLDILALVMSYVTIGIYIYKAGIIKKTIEIFENDKNAYVGFENLAFYDFIANTAYGILVFLLSIRVSRILGYSGKINEMAAVIVNAADDLLGFLIIFGIATCAYVIWGTMLFGSAEEKYSSYFKSYGTLTEAIIGKNRIANILVSKPIYAELYYFSFVIFVLFTLSTMAAAILNFSITHVKEEQEKIAPTNIVEVLWDRVMVLVNKIKGVRKNYADKRKLTERRDSDDEIRAILSDLRLFMRGVQNKQRTEEKYKVPDSEDEVEIDRNA